MSNVQLVLAAVAGFFAWWAVQKIIFLRRKNAENHAALERWRVNTQEARRWLAEFPDVATALDYLLRCDAGNENPEFISKVRDAMRNRRDFGFISMYNETSHLAALTRQMNADIANVMGVPKEMLQGGPREPVAPQPEFGIAYQHLSAECSDDTPRPSRWLNMGGA